MNPYHDRNLPRPRELNGYPLMAWKWQCISHEWRNAIRPKLWHSVTVVGEPAYTGFMRLLKMDPNIRGYVRDIEMKEGFGLDMLEVYTIMTSLPDVERLAYSPRPVSAYRQPFGVCSLDLYYHALIMSFQINLVPSSPGPMSLTIGVPFDEVTNETTRRHLLNLSRLTNLNIHVLHLTTSLTTFLRTLTQVRSLTLTVYSFSLSALEPFASVNTARRLDGEDEGLSEIVIFAMRIMDSQTETIREFLASDPRLGQICTMYAGRANDAKLVYAPEGAYRNESAVTGPSTGPSAGPQDHKEPNSKDMATSSDSGTDQEHWERMTKVKFLGGLVELTMESRK
jgi:hypothetical protein